VTIDQSTADIQKVGGRGRVTYAAVELHQRAENVELDELNLVVPSALAGTSVRIEYFATARDTRGRVEGSFEVPVVPELLPTSALLAASNRGSDEEDG
jgi:hypothetical protein